jgi:hypothetical protein
MTFVSLLNGDVRLQDVTGGLSRGGLVYGSVVEFGS